MNFKNVKFAIFCCFLAGFSPVRADDNKASVAHRDACFRNRPRGCFHNGIYIPDGQTKTVAPCQYGTCNRGRVNIAIADCAPLESGCRYESSMAECCKLICDVGCTYNGTLIAEGETKTVAPCEFATCTNGELGIMVADCAVPEKGCRIESTMEYCCKQFCDVGCKYNGTIIPEGESQKIAPCEYATCTNGEIGIAIQDCAQPQEGCRYEPTMEQCCNMICDDGCTYNGILIAEGETKTVAPCEFATCTNGELGIIVADCAVPEKGCRIESTMEYCCKQFCDGGCKYNGTIIPEGESQKIAPCEYAMCNNGEIGIAIQDCARPLEGCRYEPTMEQCCNMICDDGCMYFGEFIPEGETYTIAPCQYATCINGEVEQAVASCPRPQPGCRYESTLEECCKTICDEIVILPDVE